MGLRLLCAASLVAGLLAGLCVPATADESNLNYDEMLEQLKSGFTNIDYAQFREAYAESAHYDPYFQTDQHKTLVAAVKANDCPTVMTAANAILAVNFTDIEAHVLDADCARRTGDASTSRFHRAVARGLLSSIAASGDGKEPGTAFVVITVDEEYAWLFADGDHVRDRTLVANGGHQCDAVDITDSQGNHATVYFNVDLPMAWLAKKVATTASAPPARQAQ